MPNDPDLNEPRNLWQSQEEEKMTITLNDIRRIATRLERRIYWRNLREYGAGAIVIVACTASLWHYHGWQRAHSILLIAGTIYAMFQMHRRGATRPLPADAGLRASLDFHIRELERQRDAVHSVWKWYLLPFVPGFVALFWETAADRGIDSKLIRMYVIFTLLFVGTWLLNEWAARKLGRRIQELRKMEKSDDA